MFAIYLYFIIDNCEMLWDSISTNYLKKEMCAKIRINVQSPHAQHWRSHVVQELLKFTDSLRFSMCSQRVRFHSITLNCILRTRSIYCNGCRTCTFKQIKFHCQFQHSPTHEIILMCGNVSFSFQLLRLILHSRR